MELERETGAGPAALLVHAGRFQRRAAGARARRRRADQACICAACARRRDRPRERDAGTLAALSARYGPRYRWLLLLSVMVGTMASIMSSTIVNVAIPDMSHHFTLGQERAQWVSSGFMVAMTVSMLTTPWLLARYGYRAHLRRHHGAAAGRRRRGRRWPADFPLVLAARVAEGLAAGVVQPIPAIIILRAFEPHEQGRASGIFGMGVVLAPAHRPQHRRRAGRPVRLALDLLHGGAVLPGCRSGWPTSFVPTTAPGGVAAAARGARLDWRGLLLGTVGTLCLLNGLVELRGGDAAARPALLLAARPSAFGALRRLAAARWPRGRRSR